MQDDLDSVDPLHCIIISFSDETDGWTMDLGSDPIMEAQGVLGNCLALLEEVWCDYQPISLRASGEDLIVAEDEDEDEPEDDG